MGKYDELKEDEIIMAPHPPQPETLWGWLFGGMGGTIAYILMLLKDKVGKDQFREFKEGNTAQHKSHSKKLDTIIANMPRKK